MRVESANVAPEFISLRIEEDEGRRKFKTIHRGKFHAGCFLNVQADDVDLTAKFFFELVNDGLNRGAANSIGRLKFQQNRRTRADHRSYFFGIVHEGRLARMQDAPGGKERRDDHSESKIVVPSWFVGQQDEARHECQSDRDREERILVGD